MSEEKIALLKQQKSYEEEMQRKRNAEWQLNDEKGLKLLCNDKKINTANAPQQQKMINQDYYSEYHKHTNKTNTHPSLHWLGMSRSQDDGTIKNNSQTYRSTHSSPFRVKFRKSHTCGSLFANCNCNSVMTPIERLYDHSVPRTIPQTMARTYLSSPPPCLFSISPPSGDVSMSASSLLSTKTTSGVYSLSSQPPSAQLSRDSEDSRSASFDVYGTSPTNTSARTQTAAQTLTRQSFCEISTQLAKQVSARQNNIQRTSGVTVTITGTDAESETKLTAAEISDAKCTRQTKRLFQSYSHPDTDFVFTDENKHPLRAQQNEAVIKSKSGRVEIKQPKRSSSPNIGQVLDVAVHPDIVIKVSSRHSTASLQTPPSATQRRRLLQRTHEVESNSSTSGSEHSFELPHASTESVETLTPVVRVNDHNFDAAQKYFVESGILGPNPASNLIRKTSKILQDTNVHEQVK